MASDINDNGWIVGNAHNSKTGVDHAFLLAPIPEPETYAMLLAGLGLLGFIARRRRTA
ncbi:FxDxF family PEP-CTERM protein [Nitrosospira sp. Nsp14]|uniref:FxDxF family PEP-CTERM protein n=1 Tax=Nitrosospira sp. Nsp14 TaxID=1855333 RepID=UPI000B00D6ED|nr:FxDxF family PEP-CTERM protein [Nitrosospira sp. Nsp14]